MRNLKKITALFIALTMIFTLVSVHAAGEDVTLSMVVDKTSVKTGDVITMNIYLEDNNGADTVAVEGANYEVAFDSTQFEITDKTDETTAGIDDQFVNTISKKFGICALGNGTAKKGVPIQTLELKALAVVDNATFTLEQVVFGKAGGAIYTVAVSEPVSISVAEKKETILTMEFDKESVKVGQVATLSIYLADADGADTVAIEGANYEIAYDDTKFEITDKTDETTAGIGDQFVNTISKKFGICALGNGTAKKGVPIQILEVKPLVETDGTTFVFEQVEFGKAGGAIYTVDATSTATIVARPSFVATEAALTDDAFPTSYEIGTDVAAAFADTDITVSDGASATEAGYEATWVADFDNTVPGDYEVVGTVIGPDDNKIATWEGDLKATVNVTLTAIADGTLEDVDAIEEEATETDTDVVVEAFELDITKGDFADVIVITDGMIAVDNATIDTTVEATYEDAVTITIPAGTISENGQFVIADETVIEVDVEVEEAASNPKKPSGIGKPIGNGNGAGNGSVKPSTPGTDEPGTDEPGTDAPGTDAPVVTGTFSDVPTTHWAYEATEKLAAAGIINGVGDGTFNVDGNVTRAEFAKMIVAAMGIEATGTESAFEDCGADDWYTTYVIAATEAGYVKGISENYYGAEELISRQDICTILGRVLTAESETVAEFTDADQIADYAAQYVNALVEMGIVNGYEDGSFRPEVNATRAEAAKIINGVFELVQKIVEAE